MNAQEIFDTVVRHLKTQGKQSRTSSGTCVYRKFEADGSVLKCAVGCLIPDDVYTPEMDGDGWEIGKLVEAICDEFEDILPKYFQQNVKLFSELQKVHDRSLN